MSMKDEQRQSTTSYHHLKLGAIVFILSTMRSIDAIHEYSQPSFTQQLPPIDRMSREQRRLAHRRFSDRGWKKYQHFVEHSCQLQDETYASAYDRNAAEQYWTWEQFEFIKELRIRLLPETKTGDYSSLIGNERITTAIASLLTSEPESFCKKENDTLAQELYENDKERPKTEHDKFEDTLINKIFNKGHR